jgi:hypothetical protein
MAKSFLSSTVTSFPTKSLKYEKNNYIEKQEGENQSNETKDEKA